jgi:hypothetical protein
MIEHLTFDQRETGPPQSRGTVNVKELRGGASSKPEKLGLVYVKMDHLYGPGLHIGIGADQWCF